MSSTQAWSKAVQGLVQGSLQFGAACTNWLYLVTSENEKSEKWEDCQQPGICGSAELLRFVKS